MKAIAYNTEKQGKGVRVVNTAGLDYASDNVADVLEAIGRSKQPDTIAVVWDSTSFWKPILKLLPKQEAANLVDGKRGIIPNFRLWWGKTRWGRYIGINYKVLKLISGNLYNEYKGEIEISELQQYFEQEDVPSLEQTEVLGNQLIRALAGMGLRPDSLVSAISIYKKCVLDKMTIPTMLTMPDETIDVHELALNTVEEWVASYKKENIDVPVVSYDITNAYGSALAELPGLDGAEFVYGTEIPDPGFSWGVIKGRIHNKTLVSPLNRPDLGRPYVGFWEGIMTVDLYACLRQWDIAEMEIKEGWFMYLNKRRKPFEYSMHRLYELRSSGELQNNLAKKMSAATWGKMLETRDGKDGIEYGNMFNAIWGAMVVNNIKVKLTDFIYSNQLQDDLISVQVDGLKATKELDITTERVFGEFRKVTK